MLWRRLAQNEETGSQSTGDTPETPCHYAFAARQKMNGLNGYVDISLLKSIYSLFFLFFFFQWVRGALERGPRAPPPYEREAGECVFIERFQLGQFTLFSSAESSCILVVSAASPARHARGGVRHQVNSQYSAPLNLHAYS